jgi:hypothetical protein
MYSRLVPRQRLGKKNLPVVASQRLGENVTAATNTHAKVAELLDSSFCTWSVCKRKISDYFFPELLVSSVIITRVSLPYTHTLGCSFLCSFWAGYLTRLWGSSMFIVGRWNNNWIWSSWSNRNCQGRQKYRRIPAPVPFYPPQILHNLTWDRTRAATVRGRWLTGSLCFFRSSMYVYVVSHRATRVACRQE